MVWKTNTTRMAEGQLFHWRCIWFWQNNAAFGSKIVAPLRYDFYTSNGEINFTGATLSCVYDNAWRTISSWL